MKSNYEEKKQNRIEAFKRLASNNAELSKVTFQQVNQLSNLMNGQPILVGHHSEKRHRRDLDKMHNTMHKSVEADRKSEYYKNRVESLLNGTAISSDDPNAIDKLTEKIERLEATQELYKSINKIIKKKGTDAEKLVQLQDLGLKEVSAVKLLTPDYVGRIGIPSYKLTNNNAVIRNAKQRIEYLSKVATIESSEEEINGIKLVVSSEDNRVQLFFPGKPSEEIRKSLKSSGFHWANSLGCWMKMLSAYAIHQAKTIIYQTHTSPD